MALIITLDKNNQNEVFTGNFTPEFSKARYSDACSTDGNIICISNFNLSYDTPGLAYIQDGYK